jgi:hypothetical protein
MVEIVGFVPFASAWLVAMVATAMESIAIIALRM